MRSRTCPGPGARRSTSRTSNGFPGPVMTAAFTTPPMSRAGKLDSAPMSGPATTRRGVLLTALLLAGALAVVLVLTTSPVFDLVRHAVPKELVLHATALLGLAVMLPGWRRLDAWVIETLLGLYVVWSRIS